VQLPNGVTIGELKYDINKVLETKLSEEQVLHLIQKEFGLKETKVKGSRMDFLTDMHRCSLKMGVSTSTLHHKMKNIEEIATNVSKFLNVFWEVVPKPDEYLPELKNPCWYSNITVSKANGKFIVSSLFRSYVNRISKQRSLKVDRTTQHSIACLICCSLDFRSVALPAFTLC